MIDPRDPQLLAIQRSMRITLRRRWWRELWRRVWTAELRLCSGKGR